MIVDSIGMAAENKKNSDFYNRLTAQLSNNSLRKMKISANKLLFCCAVVVCKFVLMVHAHPADVKIKSTGKSGNLETIFDSTASTGGKKDFIKTRNFVKKPVKGEKNIFFLETSCFKSSARFDVFGGQLVLSQISLCAIESAARTNPDSVVYLLYTCPLDVSTIQRASALSAAPFAYPNVFVWPENVESVVRGSPVEALLSSGKVQESTWPVHDVSDILRLVALWKYGGVYLDLDFIVTKFLLPNEISEPACPCRRLDKSVPANFLGLNCPDNDVNNAALGFSADGVGHAFVGHCLVECASTYDGHRAYAFNGPVLLQRVLARSCELRGHDEVAPGESIVRQCGAVAVLSRSVFYPLCPTETHGYYKPGTCEAPLPELRAAVALHLYKTSTGAYEWARLRKGSGQPIDCFQRDFCPMVYNQTPEPWPEQR